MSDRSAMSAHRGVVSLRSLRKQYADVVAVDDISLDVHPGEFLTLLGPSGSGKTTTLLMVAGFVQPTGGDILIDGVAVTSVPPEKRNIGVVFQSYALFPHMTVSRNLAFPLEMRKRPEAEIARRVQEMLELVRLDRLGNRYPSQLSGGQQQRVALARAVIFDPPLLLMDEPLGALDKNLREHLQIEVRRLQRRLGVTAISVTHDQNEAMTMSDRIAVMNGGVIEQVGPPSEVYDNPATLFVAEFLGESNTLRGTVIAHELEETVVRSQLGGVIRCRRLSIPVGGSVVVMVRPASVKLSRSPSMQCPAAGTVTEVVFAGEVTRYWLEVAGVGVVSAKIPSHSDEAPIAVGDEVQVGWRSTDARGFPDDRGV